MHRVATSRWLNRALKIGERAPSVGIPLFLCPRIRLLSTAAQRVALPSPSTPQHQRRANHAESIAPDEGTTPSPPELPTAPARELPLACHGCGAFSQTHDPHSFGYFNTDSKRVRSWLYVQKRELQQQADIEGDEVVDGVLKSLDAVQLAELGLNPSTMLAGKEIKGPEPPVTVGVKPPVCDRCHDLIHHSARGDTAKITMHHPTVESLRETIEESPHKHNHIYHIIDAADFPMSLIPRLNVLLGDVSLRTRNRRSRAGKYLKDRKTEMSFIITRGDLLGPTKEIVDKMMPYLRDVLRESLGRLGDRVRLGNVRCVSARRGWWTTTLKEDIWKRGGAGWMVGKVNVGKSQLFEAVYPKGRMPEGWKAERASVAVLPREAVAAESISQGSADLAQSADNAENDDITDDTHSAKSADIKNTPAANEDAYDDVEFGDLLPPPQPVQMYPEMPVVSPFPGTTASPIRIPFGDGKGELIDLPGLARSDLELFVKEEHRNSLVMKTRVIPEQLTVKTGSSVLLGGGLIRITPKTPDLIFLVYNFTPIKEHLTSTEKAVEFQQQTRESPGLENITVAGAGNKMTHAGTFTLRHDVTKMRAGPLTRKNAIGLSVDRLAFRVLSIDLLIEGVGYVEIVAQMRAKDMARLPPLASLTSSPPGDDFLDGQDDKSASREDGFDKRKAGLRRRKESTKVPEDPNDPFSTMKTQRRDSSAPSPPPTPKEEKKYDLEWPAVDVYTPEGRFVGLRRPINGWLNNKPLVRAEHKRQRPRMSMKGAKKAAKREKRASRTVGAASVV